MQSNMAQNTIDKLIALTSNYTADLHSYNHVINTTKNGKTIYGEYLKEQKALLAKYWLMVSQLDEDDKKIMDSAFTNEEKLRIAIIYDRQNKASL